MKRIILLLGVTVSCVAIMATTCTGIVAMTPWPVADPLVGDLPIGRWAGVEDFDFEGKKANNDGDYPALIRAVGNFPGGALELNPDGTGYVLKQYQRSQS